MKPLDQTRHQLICRQHGMAVLVESLKLPIFLAESLVRFIRELRVFLGPRRAESFGLLVFMLSLELLLRLGF